MQNSAWRKAFLFCFSLVFAALFISGAPHLIASSDEEICTDIGIRPIQAYLCVSPAIQQHCAQAEQAKSCRIVQYREGSLFHATEGMFENSTSSTDANGNVLMGVSYMRSVYQVFALGDGFV